MQPSSPSSSLALHLENFGSFSSLNSPPDGNDRDSGVSGKGHRRHNSGGTGRYSGSQVSMTSDFSMPHGVDGDMSSPSGRSGGGGGELSPVRRGKRYIAKRLGL